MHHLHQSLQCGLSAFVHTKLCHDRLQYEGRVADWRQVHHQDGFRQLARQMFRDRQRQARFAHSCRTGKRDEPGVIGAQKTTDNRNLPATSDEGAERRYQSRRVGN